MIDAGISTLGCIKRQCCEALFCSALRESEQVPEHIRTGITRGGVKMIVECFYVSCCFLINVLVVLMFFSGC